MTHVRTQIRSQMKSVLEAALPASYVVSQNRKYKRNHDSSVVSIDMTITNDQTQVVDEQDDTRLHTASLYLRVQRSAQDSGMDDAQDDDELLIVAAVESADWSALLTEDPALIQVNASDNADGSSVVATLVMRYDMEYRIDKANPQTALN